QFVDDRLAFRRRDLVAFIQRRGIFAEREAFHFFQEQFQILALQIRRDFLVIPGVGGVSGKFEFVNQVVATAPDGLEVQRRADQYDAVERDAAADQISGQTGGAERSVALARDEQRR